MCYGGGKAILDIIKITRGPLKLNPTRQYKHIYSFSPVLKCNGVGDKLLRKKHLKSFWKKGEN